MNNPNSQPTLQVALIGYGSAAQVFHAPLISGVCGMVLACVCSSRPDDVHKDWPQVRVLTTPAQVFADASIDLVVIATPNDSHYELALAALRAGKHVVVDKPCTVTLAETEHLLDVAQGQGLVMTVFQNRRLDSDFLALQQVLASGALGRVVHVESHFDRYRPAVPARWREQNRPGSGLWMDLGAHLIDQALVLWGMPDDVNVDVACVRDGSLVNDWFHAVLRYDTRHGGLRVILHASTLVAELGPRWAVHGTRGSFTKFGLDAQEGALKAGLRPSGDSLSAWGLDPQPGEVLSWDTIPGVNTPVSVRRPAPNPPGTYPGYYAQLRDHLWGLTPEPMVTAAQIRGVMQILELGQPTSSPTRNRA